MKTAEGVTTYGRFGLGNDEGFAITLFHSLAGTKELSLDSIITIDLSAAHGELLVPVEIMHCSYNQLGENVKIITRELFKEWNLKT